MWSRRTSPPHRAPLIDRFECASQQGRSHNSHVALPETDVARVQRWWSRALPSSVTNSPSRPMPVHEPSLLLKPALVTRSGSGMDVTVLA